MIQKAISASILNLLMYVPTSEVAPEEASIFFWQESDQALRCTRRDGDKTVMGGAVNFTRGLSHHCQGIRMKEISSKCTERLCLSPSLLRAFMQRGYSKLPKGNGSYNSAYVPSVNTAWHLLRVIITKERLHLVAVCMADNPEWPHQARGGSFATVA